MTKSLIAGWLGTAVTFAVLDLIWLGLVADGFYRRQMGELRAEAINVPAAVAFYLIMVTCVFVFAVLPSLRSESVLMAVGSGALFGLACYAAYDLTNLATLRNWPLMLTFVDLAWGTVLTGTAAVAGYGAARISGG